MTKSRHFILRQLKKRKEGIFEDVGSYNDFFTFTGVVGSPCTFCPQKTRNWPRRENRENR